jgi:hypothetical protein
VRIPRPVNTGLDWWSAWIWRPARGYPTLAASVVVLAVSLLVWPFVPGYPWPLATAALGLLVGWGGNRPAVWAAEERADVALHKAELVQRDNDALRRGRTPVDAEETVFLPQIRETR